VGQSLGVSLRFKKARLPVGWWEEQDSGKEGFVAGYAFRHTVTAKFVNRTSRRGGAKTLD
jgi:hypothetical protein